MAASGFLIILNQNKKSNSSFYKMNDNGLYDNGLHHERVKLMLYILEN